MRLRRLALPWASLLRPLRRERTVSPWLGTAIEPSLPKSDTLQRPPSPRVPLPLNGRNALWSAATKAPLYGRPHPTTKCPARSTTNRGDERVLATAYAASTRAARRKRHPRAPHSKKLGVRKVPAANGAVAVFGVRRLQAPLSCAARCRSTTTVVGSGRRSCVPEPHGAWQL